MFEKDRMEKNNGKLNVCIHWNVNKGKPVYRVII